MSTVFKALKAPNGRRCRPMCCGRAVKRDALPFSCFVFIQVCYHLSTPSNLNLLSKSPKIAWLWLGRMFARLWGQTRHTGRNTALFVRIKLTMQQCKWLPLLSFLQCREDTLQCYNLYSGIDHAQPLPTFRVRILCIFFLASLTVRRDMFLLSAVRKISSAITSLPSSSISRISSSATAVLVSAE